MVYVGIISIEEPYMEHLSSCVVASLALRLSLPKLELPLMTLLRNCKTHFQLYFPWRRDDDRTVKSELRLCSHFYTLYKCQKPTYKCIYLKSVMEIYLKYGVFCIYANIDIYSSNVININQKCHRRLIYRQD